MKKIFFSIAAFISLIIPTVVLGQGSELVVDKQEMVKAKVIEVVHEERKAIPGTDVLTDVQTIRIEILEGQQKGKVVQIENDYLSLNEGEVFYLNHMTDNVSQAEFYTVGEPYRLPKVLALVGLFIIAVFFFGGMQGMRGLLSLAGSLLLIMYVLLPGVLHGYSPLLVTTGVSSLIIIVGSYITHGFNRTTTSAVVGMIGTIVITGFLAYAAVHWTRLSGFGSEEVTYLNLNTRGSLDVVGLLLGGIMIGLLGVLYDVAIGQAISVEELLRIAPHVSKKKIYERAIRIGREHIGALVNTLAIAYVGASLPLLLLISSGPNTSLGVTLNMEIFSTEIVRTMIGSIGLVLAVPITTIFAVWYLTRRIKQDVNQEVLMKEEHALEHLSHNHKH